MQDYLKKLVVKIYNRYLKVVSKYDSYKIDYLLPNPYPMFDINKPILDRKLVSLLAFEFKNRCERILNWNETEEKNTSKK